MLPPGLRSAQAIDPNVHLDLSVRLEVPRASGCFQGEAVPSVCLLCWSLLHCAVLQLNDTCGGVIPRPLVVEEEVVLEDKVPPLPRLDCTS